MAARRDGSVHAGRNPPVLYRRDLFGHRADGEGCRSRHPSPRFLAARGAPRRGDARPATGRISERAEGSRPWKPARHRRRNSRRRGSPLPLPRQDRHGALAGGHARRARGRAALDRHDHVRPYRPLRALGAPSAAHQAFAAGNRRLHRDGAAALRAYGSADLSEGQGQARPDIPGSGADACRLPAGAASS